MNLLYISFLFPYFVQSISLFTSLSLGSKPIGGNSPLLNCDVGDDQILTIRNIDLLPNPPRRGMSLIFTALGDIASEIVTGAYIDVEVVYGYIKILDETFDLCQELEENDIDGLSCPLGPGEYSIEKVVQIPQEVPPGKYVVTARAYTHDDIEITCITGQIIFPGY